LQPVLGSSPVGGISAEFVRRREIHYMASGADQMPRFQIDQAPVVEQAMEKSAFAVECMQTVEIQSVLNVVLEKETGFEVRVCGRVAAHQMFP